MAHVAHVNIRVDHNFQDDSSYDQILLDLPREPRNRTIFPTDSPKTDVLLGESAAKSRNTLRRAPQELRRGLRPDAPGESGQASEAPGP